MKTLHLLNKIILAASTLTLFSACADLNQDGEDMDAVNKIIGGQVVRNAPDHLGAVILFTQEGPIQTCTATLIDNDSILTAAHCWGITPEEKAFWQGNVAAGNVAVCFGESDWNPGNQALCPNNKAAQVVNFTVPTQFHTDWANYDISVAHLGGSFPEISKPQLARSRNHIKGDSTSFGYGANKTKVLKNGQIKRKATGDSQLRSLQRPTLTIAECNTQINKLKGPQVPVSNSNICIDVNKKNNVCHGDSGGPTFIKGRLAGVVSRGTSNLKANGVKKTCDGSGPSVLTNVRKFRSWIQSQM